MLPRDYQDMGMQTSCEKKLTYSEVRDHTLGMANQKLQWTRPVPLDVGGVEEKNGESQQGLEEGTHGASLGIDAVSQNMQCYACWQ